MICRKCGKPLKDSQYNSDRTMKSCPKCSEANGLEHVYFPYPSGFGTSDKRKSSNNPDGPQSYCTVHRGNPSSGQQSGGTLCSQI